MVYKSNALAAGGGSAGTGGGTVSNITSTGSTITVGSPTGPTTNVDVANNTANTLAGYNNSGVFSDVIIGTNLTLSGGTLNASGGGAVSSVFGRTGAVTANWNDYQFNLIGGTAAVSQGGTGLATLTAHAVILGEGVSAVSFATTGTSGRLLIDQGSGNDPAFEVLSGDITITKTGASSVVAIQGTIVTGVSGTSNVVFSNQPTLTSANFTGITSITTTGNISVGGNIGLSGAVNSGSWQGNTVAVQYGGTGQSTLTTHAVLLGEGAVTGVGFATTGVAARILIDQGNADPSFQVLTGDSTLTSSGVMVNTAVHGVSYGTNPSTNTVPVVTGTNTVTYEQVPNAALLNSAITIGAQTGLSGGGAVALGSAITLSMGIGIANTLAGYNSSGVFSDVSIGTNLNLVGGILGTSNISAGTSLAISYSTNTVGIAYTGSATGVSTITNTDSSLTISPQTGVVQASLNTAHANTWTATQTGAISGGVTNFISTGCIEFSIFANGNSGSGTPTLKWDNGNIQSVTITGACTLGFTAPTHPGRLTIISTMSATTGYPYAYAGTVLWPGGTKPTLSSISNAKDVSSFLYDGSNYYGIANTTFS